MPHSEIFHWQCAESESTSKISRGPRLSRRKGNNPRKENLCQNYNSSWLQKFLTRSGRGMPKRFTRKGRSDIKSPELAPQRNLREIIGKRKLLRKVIFELL